MSIEIVYPREELFASFYDVLGSVAAEGIYLEMIEAPPLERVLKVQRDLVASNGAVYYAVDGDRVVGWCDIFPESSPREAHRGGLGMGCLPEYRGQGVGTRLLEAAMKHAKEIGLEKVELRVYTSNQAAIKLYEKFDFRTEGLIHDYRKLGAQYFDCLVMGKFI